MWQQIILIGNLGRDPEMKYTNGGKEYTKFSLAVNERWTGQDGTKQEKTLWIECTCWGNVAKSVSQYMTKGRQVQVIGTLSEPWAYVGNNDQLPHATLQVNARQVNFLGGGNGNGAGGNAPPAQDAPSDADIPF